MSGNSMSGNPMSIPLLDHVTQTLERHEDELAEHRTTATNHAVQLATIDQKLTQVGATVDKMDKNIGKVVWLIITGVIVAVLHLVLKK